MALQAPAYRMVTPSFSEPELLLQYNQPSGFIAALAGEEMRVRLAEDDLVVYIRQLNMRTKMAAAQATFMELPGVDVAASFIGTPTYLLKVREEYDHHDTAAAGRWGFPLVEAYRLAMRQGNFQLARDAALHGMNPANGEGLLNANGATAVNLPADSWGNDTVLTYDNGEMAFFLAQEILALKVKTLQLGLGQKFTLLGPQRTLGSFEYNVVSLTQFQREGAGTNSTAGTVKNILEKNGDLLNWCYDDSLQGIGPGGADAVLLVEPELEKPNGPSPVNTNEFANLLPGNKVMTTQYCDMAAPREIISPLAGGATDMMMEWRISSGWAPRPQGVSIIYMVY